MTDNIKREEWLKSLKEGDRVWNSRQNGYVFYTIKKITPTGKIRLNNDTLLDKDGYGSTNFRFSNTYYHIQPITKEILDDIKHRKERSLAIKELKEVIDNLNIGSFSIDRIKELTNMLKEFNNKEEEL